MEEVTNDKTLASPRLSRTSVFYPTIISAENNIGARKTSGATEISPMTNQVKLEAILSETARVAPLVTESPEQPDKRPTSLASADFDRRESVAEPAGSGMPPSETAFLFEKEVVTDHSIPEIKHSRDQTRHLELPPQQHGALRPAQSLIPAGLSAQVPPIDASTGFEAVNARHRSVSPALLRSSFSSESSLADSHMSATDGASVIFQAAQQARLKRPSLVNDPAAGDSVSQLANLTRFIRDREMQSADDLPVRKMHPSDGSRPQSFLGVSRIMNDSWTSMEALGVGCEGNALNPPGTARCIDPSSLPNPTDPMSLQDALKLNRIDVGAIPKRTVTVPISTSAKRKARFAPLSIATPVAGKFRRDSVVTTPYPKSRSTDGGGGAPQGLRDEGPRPLDFNLTITARHRSSTISVPQFGPHKAETEVWWNAKEVDDKKLVQLVKDEFSKLQGRLRHALSARTARFVRLRLVRSDKCDHFGDPDSPLIGGRWNHDAESDFWSLWIDPAQGQNKRHWLDELNSQSRLYGTSRVLELEIIEGYDAARILVAFSIITALSLIAMLLWLFLGPDKHVGSSGTSIDVHGVVHIVENDLASTSGSPTVAFVFAVWVLTLGWTGVGAWMLIS